MIAGSLDQAHTESYQSEDQYENSQVILSDAKFRVVAGYVGQRERNNLEKTLIDEGGSLWLITLSIKKLQFN